MAVRKRKNEKSKSETKNDDKSDQNIQESSSKLSIICLGTLVDPLTFTTITTNIGADHIWLHSFL